MCKTLAISPENQYIQLHKKRKISEDMKEGTPSIRGLRTHKKCRARNSKVSPETRTASPGTPPWIRVKENKASKIFASSLAGNGVSRSIHLGFKRRKKRELLCVKVCVSVSTVYEKDREGEGLKGRERERERTGFLSTAKAEQRGRRGAIKDVVDTWHDSREPIPTWRPRSRCQ